MIPIQHLKKLGVTNASVLKRSADATLSSTAPTLPNPTIKHYLAEEIFHFSFSLLL